MTTTEIFRALVEYNHALYCRVWDSLLSLTDEQFTQDVAYSHGSLRNQLVHVTATQMRWLMGLRDQPDARTFTLNLNDYPTRESVHALWEKRVFDD